MRRANLTVPEKLKMQRDGYRFFCEHHKTAKCAIGENIGLTCVHAPNHKTREGCRYWKPVHIERKDEITRLRAELATVTAERDRMREAFEKAANDMHPILRSMISRNEAAEIVRRAARAALEGVTEPASPWRDIESAPRDGTWIFIYKDSWHGAIKAKWDAIDGVDSPFMAWVFQDEFLCIGCAEGCLGYNEDIEDGYMPTHWMPLPERPANTQTGER